MEAEMWDEITDEYLEADPQDKIELLRFKRWVNDRKTQFEEELLDVLEEDEI